MYIAGETFIATTGAMFSDGDEITEKQYQELPQEDQKKFRWYKDADDEDYDTDSPDRLSKEDD